MQDAQNGGFLAAFIDFSTGYTLYINAFNHRVITEEVWSAPSCYCLLMMLLCLVRKGQFLCIIIR